MTRTPQVLLVEDDEPLRSVLCRALERAGYRAVAAANGHAALEVIQEPTNEIDAVVTDIVMPDMEGIELIMSLRRTHPTLPVVAMSGGGRSSPHGYLQIARGAGAACVLAKPFEIEALLDAVGSLVGTPGRAH